MSGKRSAVALVASVLRGVDLLGEERAEIDVQAPSGSRDRGGADQERRRSSGRWPSPRAAPRAQSPPDRRPAAALAHRRGDRRLVLAGREAQPRGELVGEACGVAVRGQRLAEPRGLGDQRREAVGADQPRATREIAAAASRSLAASANTRACACSRSIAASRSSSGAEAGRRHWPRTETGAAPARRRRGWSGSSGRPASRCTRANSLRAASRSAGVGGGAPARTMSCAERRVVEPRPLATAARTRARPCWPPPPW